MRALVIWRGSKGALQVERLLEEEKKPHDLFLGLRPEACSFSPSSGKVETIKEVFTQVNQSSIFSNNPFW